jgi:lipoate-protein ligase A
VKLLDFSASSPALNLALDETLLLAAERGESGAILRFWESPIVFAVLGYSRHAQKDLDLSECRKDGVPVLRRHTGGGTVLQGPGCLNYALILPIVNDGPLSTIGGTIAYVLRRHANAFSDLLGKAVEVSGGSDLSVGRVKFSGNAQRRLRHFLLFHGTVLLEFDLALMERYLALPDQQPEYRAGRSHREFLRNLPLTPGAVRGALARAWSATEMAGAPDLEAAGALASSCYGNPSWTFRLP